MYCDFSYEIVNKSLEIVCIGCLQKRHVQKRHMGADESPEDLKNGKVVAFRSIATCVNKEVY